MSQSRLRSVLLDVSLACSLAAAAVACSSGGGNAAPTGQSPDASDADASAATDAGAPAEGGSGGVDAGVRWIGRVDLSSDAGARFAWSGTGFKATVSGTTISVSLTTTGSTDPVYFQPVIDGTPGTRFAVPDGTQTVTLGSGLADADHAVELYRDTEGRYGTTVFGGFVDGTVKAPPASPGRLIEIVGDSISAGYGDLGSEQHPNFGADPEGGCPFSTQTESAYVAYGMVAARSLGADPSIVAVSGWGMYQDNVNNTSNVLPSVYADTLGLSHAPAWSFQPEPQAVVINLGTNDFAPVNMPTQAQFGGAYTAFIATVRAKYPDAWIFCTVGPLLFATGLADATADIQAVVASAQAAGDAKVQYLDFGQQNTSLGTGCQYHPNVTEQNAMATTLAGALRLALGW
jgi:lysophospholipase L1-like esterase